ncbi:GIY-YIG nuclease family protein [Aestuariispira ectoiniformans]|uniref:GIY-YIG nuclease family protein n=1 Tax=Aestuariispira ectoiniformans TaxID=2775080 RepID=UPI0028830E0B|nr:GIY-YIG nuclease family protein [Aestuariispira ectoiniformans]
MKVVRKPCVYILASEKNGTLYVGVTSDIIRRVNEHREGKVQSFTRRYKVYRLVYTEFHASMLEAITREKCLKRWCRAWKIRLIEKANPAWQDLYDEVLH